MSLNRNQNPPQAEAEFARPKAKSIKLGIDVHLDRYVNGNYDACWVVRVPTPEQERERSISRQRESFQREKQRLAAQGRSHALYYDEHIQGEWWQEEVWKTAAAQLPPIVVNLLEP